MARLVLALHIEVEVRQGLSKPEDENGAVVGELISFLLTELGGSRGYLT